LPTLAHLNESRSKLKDVTYSDLTLAKAERADVFSESAGTIEKSHLAYFPSPMRVMVEGIVMDCLLGTTVTTGIALLVPEQPRLRHDTKAFDFRLGYSAKDALGSQGRGFPNAQTYDLVCCHDQRSRFAGRPARIGAHSLGELCAVRELSASARKRPVHDENEDLSSWFGQLAWQTNVSLRVTQTAAAAFRYKKALSGHMPDTRER